MWAPAHRTAWTTTFDLSKEGGFLGGAGEVRPGWARIIAGHTDRNHRPSESVARPHRLFAIGVRIEGPEADQPGSDAGRSSDEATTPGTIAISADDVTLDGLPDTVAIQAVGDAQGRRGQQHERGQRASQCARRRSNRRQRDRLAQK